MIIGLVGFIGSGKGTVADLLVQRHGFVKESFANSVKDSVAAVFGWHRDWLEGDTPDSRKWRETKDEWWSNALGREVTPRWALQLMGTEAGRDVFHPDLWVHTAFRRMDWDPQHHYVIADVRFPNEIKAIQKYGGKCVRVQRGVEPNLESLHVSETAWLHTALDAYLDNNCTLEVLTERVDQLVEILYNK